MDPHGAHTQGILLLGGHDGQQWTTMMHLFHPELSAVQDYDQIPFSQGYGGCILLGRSIYVIGGGDGVNWNRTAFNFDLDSKDWFQVRPCAALPQIGCKPSPSPYPMTALSSAHLRCLAHC